MKISLTDYYTLLGPYFRRFKGYFMLSAVLLLTSIALQAIAPQFVKRFIDLAMGEAALSRVVLMAVLFLCVNVFQQIIAVGATYAGQNLAWLATNELRVDLARHCLNLDMAFHNSKLKGELIERIDGDVSKIGNFFSQLLLIIIGNLLLMLCVLVLIFRENGVIGIAMTITSGISVYLINTIRSLAVESQKKFQQVDADLYGYLEERLSSTEDIRSLGAVDFIMNGFFHISKKFREALWNVHKRIIVIQSMGYLVSVFMSIVSFPLCFYLFYRDELSVGSVFMIVIYISFLTGPIRKISDQVQSLQGVGASVARTQELLDTEVGIKDGQETLTKDHFFSISFDHVSFAYAAENPVLRDICFSLDENQVLGVIGRTGSGKTTLSRLLFRLYEADAGSVRIGNRDIRDFRLASLRKNVAMVTQDIQLFRATVRENLTFFNSEISDNEIMEALSQLQLLEWFKKLPNGLDTILNTGDSGLSAGEAQLLAFTRVFLKDPRLIILDEASSRLDPATEKLLDQAIHNLIKDRSAIIIAHRLQTIERADAVLIMEEGKVKEFGERERLKADERSIYSAILNTGLEEDLV